MECLTSCYRAFFFRVVRALASLTPCLVPLSAFMESKFGYPPRRGHPAADQIAASLSLGTPKHPPRDEIVSKLELDYEVWVRSGVLDLLNKADEERDRI